MKIVRLGPDEVFHRFLTPKWAFVPLSGVGAAIDGGRFNRPGVEALYLSRTPQTALEEYRQGASITPPATRPTPAPDASPITLERADGSERLFRCCRRLFRCCRRSADSGCMAELGGACAREAQSGGEMAARRGLIFPSKVRDPFFANTVGVAQNGFRSLATCGVVWLCDPQNHAIRFWAGLTPVWRAIL